MLDFGVSGYTARVGRVEPGTWAHCDPNRKELVFGRALLLCDWIFVNQIVLHEVAHALAGPRAGHGKKWRDTAHAMGYTLGVAVAYVDVGLEQHTWVATCQQGLHSALRYERGGADGEIGCGKCVADGLGDVGVLWQRL